MERSTGKTHTLYPVVLAHKKAKATCYRCGARARAQRMWWAPYDARAYFALCSACAPLHVMDAVAQANGSLALAWEG